MNKVQLNEKAAQIYVKERRIIEGMEHAGVRQEALVQLEWLAYRFDELLGLEWHNYIIEVTKDGKHLI